MAGVGTATLIQGWSAEAVMAPAGSTLMVWVWGDDPACAVKISPPGPVAEAARNPWKVCTPVTLNVADTVAVFSGPLMRNAPGVERCW